MTVDTQTLTRLTRQTETSSPSSQQQRRRLGLKPRHFYLLRQRVRDHAARVTVPLVATVVAAFIVAASELLAAPHFSCSTRTLRFLLSVSHYLPILGTDFQLLRSPPRYRRFPDHRSRCRRRAAVTAASSMCRSSAQDFLEVW